MDYRVAGLWVVVDCWTVLLSLVMMSRESALGPNLLCMNGSMLHLTNKKHRRGTRSPLSSICWRYAAIHSRSTLCWCEFQLINSVSMHVEDVARWLLENWLLLNTTSWKRFFGTRMGSAQQDFNSKWYWRCGDSSAIPRNCQAARCAIQLGSDDGPARYSLKLYAAAATTYVLCGTSDHC